MRSHELARLLLANQDRDVFAIRTFSRECVPVLDIYAGLYENPSPTCSRGIIGVEGDGLDDESCRLRNDKPDWIPVIALDCDF